MFALYVIKCAVAGQKKRTGTKKTEAGQNKQTRGGQKNANGTKKTDIQYKKKTTNGTKKNKHAGQKKRHWDKLKKPNSGQKTISVCVCVCVCLCVFVRVFGLCVCWCVLCVVVCCVCCVCVVFCAFSPPSAGPSPRTALRRTALRRTAQNIALFFPSPAHIFVLFLSLSGGSFR